MKPGEARAVLRHYADAAQRRDQAIHTLKANGVTIAEIVRLSGLSRTGVEKIIARQETPMRTLQIDATAGAVMAVMADLWPGQLQPSVGGGVLVEVTLPEDRAAELVTELNKRNYFVR